ncbi:MAG: hypothetical protein M3Y59_20545 [Myxococcota bacterium]|nr:hypothetical protein [Myxococcota bacterium]
MSEPKHLDDAAEGSGLELDWGDRRSGPPEPASEAASPLAARFAALSSEGARESPAERAVPVARTGATHVSLHPGVDLPFPPPARWTAGEEDAAMEHQLRRWCLPVALVSAWLLVQTGIGRFVAQIFSGMWLHELGHAITAWLCGRFALPGPWKTSIGEERSWAMVLCVSGAITYLAHRQRTAERPGWYRIPVALFAAQLIGTLLLRPSRVDLWITFGGEAGAMLLGALLMMTFYASPESQLRRGWLRWGFLVLGALAFMETADTWWDAVSDPDRIPFGEIEGVGLSDPSKLTGDHGWSTRGMVRAYVGVSLLALLAVGVAYLRGLIQREEHEG